MNQLKCEWPWGTELVFMEGSVSMVKVYWHNDSPFEGYISSLYVDKEKRGQGYGNKMLEIAVRILKVRGFDSATLWCRKDQPETIKWYERHGFKYVKNYDEEEAVWLQKIF